MKKLILFFAPLLFISLAALCQAKYYKCEWTKGGTNYLFKGLMKLEFANSGGIVQGRIIWTVLSADTKDEASVAYYRGKMNKSGIEIIEGDYDEATKDLKFAGITKIDRDSVIGLDQYTLKISADNTMIYGKTDSNGEKNGFFYATLQNTVIAKKEFDLLVSKIKK